MLPYECGERERSLPPRRVNKDEECLLEIHMELFPAVCADIPVCYKGSEEAGML